MSVIKFLASAILAVASTVSLQPAIIYHADYEEMTGPSDEAIKDGIFGYDRSGGGVIDVVSGGGDHPQPRAGSNMLYMEIDKTDDDYGCNGCKRVEMKMDPFVRDLPFDEANGMSIFGDTYWYAWSVFIPTNQGADGKQLMGQWASRWDNGGYNEGATLSLELANDKWVLSIQRGRDPYLGRILQLGSVSKGEWTDWVFQIRWDMKDFEADNTDGQPGYIRVWKNGELWDNDNDGFSDVGENCFQVETADEAPFLKLGVYKGADRVWIPERRVAYYDELRIGDARATYADMAPGGNGPMPTPSITISPSSVKIPEGQSQTVSISLSMQPAEAVTLTVAKESGDADITLTGSGELTFAPDNWDIPQSIRLNAAEDDDALNGAATFKVTGEGVLPGAFSALEEDRDTFAGGDAIPPVADSYVRGGEYSNDNYGTEGILRTKDGSGEASQWDREVYIKFDVSSLKSTPEAAVLVLTMVSNDGGSFNLHAVANDDWTETGITWNSPGSKLGERLVAQDAPASGETVQIDVTSYVLDEIAGDGMASFGIWAGGDYWVDFASRETDDGPKLAFSFPGGNDNGGDTSSWGGFPVNDEGLADTGDWLGWVRVSGDFIYSWAMDQWVYFPSGYVQSTGGWGFVFRN